MPPVVRAYISPEEVYPGRQVTYDEIAVLAATLNRTEALKFLGYLNLLLSSATTESHLKNQLQPMHDVQTWLFREIVSAALLRDLQAKFREASLLDRPVLHRTQLLFAIRVVATHGRADGGNMLTERRDFDAIGDLTFLISGLFKVPPPTSEAAKALWLATQMGPQYELENPPAVELSWPRTEDPPLAGGGSRPRGTRSARTHHRVYDGLQPAGLARPQLDVFAFWAAVISASS